MGLTFSYSGDPSTSPGDAVRFLLGDTDGTDPQLGDQEITYLLSQQSNNPYLAASFGAMAIASKYGRMIDKSVGDLKMSFSQRQKTYAALAISLRDQALTNTSVDAPYMGGLTTSDKSFDENNPDQVQPSFRRGLTDYNQQSNTQPGDNPIPGSGS